MTHISELKDDIDNLYKLIKDNDQLYKFSIFDKSTGFFIYDIDSRKKKHRNLIHEWNSEKVINEMKNVLEKIIHISVERRSNVDDVVTAHIYVETLKHQIHVDMFWIDTVKRII